MRSGLRFAFILGALVLSAAMAQTVRADETFDITWTGGYGPGNAVATVTDLGGGTFLLDSLTGTQNGSSISLLAPNTYGENDNDVYPGSTSFSGALLDIFGMAFSAGGLDYNIFFFDSAFNGGTDQYVECVSSVEPACVSYDEETAALPLTNFTISEVSAPEPGSLLLLSLGLAGLIGAWIYTKRTFVGMPA